jgi:hypothetical protein
MLLLNVAIIFQFLLLFCAEKRQYNIGYLKFNWREFMKKIFTMILVLTLPNVLFSQTKPVDSDGDGFLNISTLDELRWVSENTTDESLYLELDNDIDAADTRNWNVGDHDGNPTTPDSAMGWQPISEYSGVFDGRNHKIMNLYIHQPDNERPYGDMTGFFFTINPGSKVMRLGLVDCQIHGNCWVGALAGLSGGDIESCYSTGTVAGNGDVSGLIGSQLGGYIANCYSLCNISGESVGGIVGEGSCGMYNSYYAGKIKSHSGGSLARYNADWYGGTIINSFWNTDLNECKWDCHGTGLSTTEMKTKSTYTESGWDFDKVWAINDTINEGYPYLIDNSVVLAGVEPVDNDENGFRNINCFSNLVWIKHNREAWKFNYELDNNIDADSSKIICGDLGFSIPFYSGHFNGNGYAIDKLFLNLPMKGNVGFFNSTDSATIDNLKLENCYVRGRKQVGGMVGLATYYKTNFRNCSVSGKIYGEEFVGGLVGMSGACKIEISNNEADVNGEINVGGIAGSGDKLVNCFNTGSVSGIENIGGLLGVAYIGVKTTNCFNVGEVKGEKAIGGILGYLDKNHPILLDTIIINSFWDKETAAIDTSAGGTGLPTAQMKTKSTYTQAGWDFENIWAIDGETNDGYPFFRTEPAAICEEVLSEGDFLVYPNPAVNVIHIRSTPATGESVVKIYSSTGDLLLEACGNDIDISSLPAGVYFAVVDAGGKIQSSGFIKE